MPLDPLQRILWLFKPSAQSDETVPASESSSEGGLWSSGAMHLLRLISNRGKEVSEFLTAFLKYQTHSPLTRERQAAIILISAIGNLLSAIE